MRIESEKIKLAPFDEKQLGKLRLDQVEILGLLKQGHSIHDVVQHFSAGGRLVSFLAIQNLLEILLSKRIILNTVFYNYFQNATAPKLNTPSGPPPLSAAQPDRSKIKKVPFLRSLNPSLLETLIKNSSVMEVPAGVVFCQEGAEQRSMLVLLSGQATVYKKNPAGGFNKIVSLNEGSLFGESGFFFGTPRTATVVADTACQVLILKYVPGAYDELIKTDKARELQWRIWAIHALLKAELFKNLPQECFDALIFAGTMTTFQPRQLICRQGDTGEACYVVVQGKLGVSIDGKAVNTLGQGDCFGEMALMVTGGKRMASVQTESEGILLEIPAANFYKMLSENLLLACGFEKVALQRKASAKPVATTAAKPAPAPARAQAPAPKVPPKPRP